MFNNVLSHALVSNNVFCLQAHTRILKTGSDLHFLQSKKQSMKKKRKNRTAFTNSQIFELEKAFLYQKYLAPRDKEELSRKLGLTNAQVITWFQNRRAKLRRDVEELKKDEHTSKLLRDHSAFLKMISDLGVTKANTFYRQVMEGH